MGCERQTASTTRFNYPLALDEGMLETTDMKTKVSRLPCSGRYLALPILLLLALTLVDCGGRGGAGSGCDTFFLPIY
jgi:hypothetical protein